MTETVLLAIAGCAVAFGAVMGAVAWRLSREERRRSEARVAALAAAIHQELPLQPDDDGSLRSVGAPALVVQTGTRSVASVVVGVAVVGSIALIGIMISGLAVAPTSTQQRPGPAATGNTLRAALPLELIALGHERNADELTVRGIVRNPVGSRPLTGVTAVVTALDANGLRLASARAPILRASLAPGGQSTFTVDVDGAAAVARYRIGFEIANHVVPHFDRRDAGQTARRP